MSLHLRELIFTCDLRQGHVASLGGVCTVVYGSKVAFKSLGRMSPKTAGNRKHSVCLLIAGITVTRTEVVAELSARRMDVNLRFGSCGGRTDERCEVVSRHYFGTFKNWAGLILDLIEGRVSKLRRF